LFCVLHREQKQELEKELAETQKRQAAEIEEQRKREEQLVLANREKAEIEERRNLQEKLAETQKRQAAEIEQQRNREEQLELANSKAAERQAYLEEMRRQLAGPKLDAPKLDAEKLDDVEIEIDEDDASASEVGGGEESPSSPFVGAAGSDDVRMKSRRTAEEREKAKRKTLKNGSYTDTTAEEARKARLRKPLNENKVKLAVKMAKLRQIEQLPPFKAEASLEDTVFARRPYLYTATTNQWQPYAEGVEVVAAHIRSLLRKSATFGGKGWVKSHLAFNALTEVIYDWFVNVATDPPFMNRLNAISSLEQIQDEYTVLDALCNSGVSNPELWTQYLEGAKDSLEMTRRQEYGTTMDLYLKSDLHTTPADASLHTDVTRDGLATRLDRLRDF
jgi:hypothetical protein